MKKILADEAYQKGFREWVTNKLLGVALEITANPPQTNGFVPVKWRWISERGFAQFNFFRRLDKERLLLARKLGFCGTIVNWC